MPDGSRPYAGGPRGRWPGGLGQRLAEIGLLIYFAEVPFSAILGAEAQAPAWLAILLGLLVFQASVWRGAEAGRRFHLVWPVLAFFFSFVLSILNSTDAALSAGRSVFLPMGLLFFFGVQLAEDPLDARRRLSAVGLFVLAALGVQGLYQAAFGEALLSNQQLYAGRIRSGLPHPNDIAVVPLLVPLVIWGIGTSTRLWMKAVSYTHLTLPTKA